MTHTKTVLNLEKKREQKGLNHTRNKNQQKFATLGMFEDNLRFLFLALYGHKICIDCKIIFHKPKASSLSSRLRLMHEIKKKKKKLKKIELSVQQQQHQSINRLPRYPINI